VVRDAATLNARVMGNQRCRSNIDLARLRGDRHGLNTGVYGKVTFNSQGLWAAAALALVSAVLCIADMVATPKAVERLRKHGLIADATIAKVKEHYVIEMPYTGWVTRVKVSFVDAPWRYGPHEVLRA
jgi:hypothetical protein